MFYSLMKTAELETSAVAMTVFSLGVSEWVSSNTDGKK